MGVRLVDGATLASRMIVVGIGIVPAVQPLLDAGADGGNGVCVDGECRTSLANIVAIGDCAEHQSRYAANDWVRIESVQNANNQAAIAAAAITGNSNIAQAVPWFWSSRYDLKLQTVGLSHGYDAMVMRGNPATRSFSVVCLRNGSVIALDCVNAVRDYSHGRALVSASVKPDLAALADTRVALKHLLQ